MDIYKHLDSFENEAAKIGDFRRATRYSLIRAQVNHGLSTSDAVDKIIVTHYTDIRDEEGKLLA